MKRGDEVEAPRRERRVHWVTVEHVRRDLARVRRRFRIDLDSRDGPADRLHQAHEAPHGAADVEQAALAHPRHERLADAPAGDDAAQPRGQQELARIEMTVAESLRARAGPPGPRRRATRETSGS